MAEVLGAVAAAAQLTATCLALIELTKRIKGRSSILKSYQEQLAQLSNLSNDISSNPLLQTQEIEVHTRSILSLLSTQSLESPLKQGRVSQILLFFSQERTLAKLFSDLERQKATLSLAINEIQSRTLHDIHNTLSTMSVTGQESHRKTFDVKSFVSSSASGENMEMVPYDNNTAGGSSGLPQASRPLPQVRPTAAELAARERAEYWVGFYKRTYPDRSSELPTWIACNAGKNMLQTNGLEIHGDFDQGILDKAANGAETRVFMACEAEPGGFQFNGTKILTSDSGKPETICQSRGQYIGCQMSSDVSGSKIGKERTVQVNGTYVGPKTSPA